MTRKETIIISVMVNLGVLAILLLTARTDNEPAKQSSDAAFIADTFQDAPKVIKQTEKPFKAPEETALELALQNSPSSIPYLEEDDQFIDQELDLLALEPPPSKPVISGSDTHFEIKVKRGDFLQKIARANGTSIEEIKKINHLTSEKLVVGQVLKIPKNSQAKAGVEKKEQKSQQETFVADGDAVYYTVKSGDNPWKIAKQFHLRVDDLVKLNKLNEESARNMKVGDKIRVR